MLWTNYKCVQSQNTYVDDAKSVKIFHKLAHYTHFFSVAKKWLVLIEQSIHGKVKNH